MKTVIYAYSEITGDNLRNNFGKPQYSYYFVLEKFLPVLRQVGDVIVIRTPDEADEALPANYDADTRRILFSFTPPHRAPTHLQCPVITVFAWEFSTLPTETWDDDPRNDWRHVFARHVGAIPLSRETAALIRELMGPCFPVEPIPVPLPAAMPSLQTNDGPFAPRHASAIRNILDIGNTPVIDSRLVSHRDMVPGLDKPAQQLMCGRWDGEELALNFCEPPAANHLIGFHEHEHWGVWSRTVTPAVLLPLAIHGNVELEVDVAAFAKNTGAFLGISVGNTTHRIPLTNQFETHRISLSSADEFQMIAFSGIPLLAVDHPDDQRRIGFGLRHVRITRTKQRSGTAEETGSCTEERAALELAGVIYASVLTPFDHRKNWMQILTAFVHAFRDDPQATLVFKMTHDSLFRVAGKIIEHFCQLQPFSCRVICITGFLSPAQMDSLRSMTHFYVNASSCEGLCLPVMEFMSGGIPGIAPRNTAMQDYVSERSHLVVQCSPAPTIWPHDPRQVIRTQHYNVHWDSLEACFRESAELARHYPERYQQMSLAAIKAMEEFCSHDVILAKLQGILARIFDR